MDGLEDFLKGSEQPEATETVTPEPETEVVATPPETAEEPKGPVRDDKGRFTSKGEEEESATPAQEDKIPVKALQEERRKRQEYEDRTRALEEQIRQLQQPAQPAPSMWEDEQGWQQHFGSQVVSTAVQQATFNARLDMSEMMARQNHADFEDKKGTFLELIEQTPGLREKALSDPHPWNFAYNYVANHQRMQELSAVNVTDLEARLREQITAELAAKTTAAPEIPDSLADAQSARAGAGSTQSLHVPSFDEILKRK